MKTLLIPCECRHNEHSICVEYDIGDEQFPPSLTINAQMSQRNPFWKRILIAFKYIFNMHHSYHWDCTMLSDDSALQLNSLLLEYIEDLKTWKKNCQT